VSQVKGLIREVGAAIELNIGRDVEERVNTHKAVKEMMDETVKTVQGIIETSEKKMIEVLEAKIAEALASIKA
jgi:CO dehydrogenase/acetyl-CoA synthase alpha subunit